MSKIVITDQTDDQTKPPESDQKRGENQCRIRMGNSDQNLMVE